MEAGRSSGPSPEEHCSRGISHRSQHSTTSDDPCTLKQRFENQRRLLTLTEKNYKNAAKSRQPKEETHVSHQLKPNFPPSTSSEPAQKPSSAQRMGLRLGDKRVGRSATSCNGDHSLPDKLTQALKALRPGVLTHSSSSTSPFRAKSSNFVVTADDVIYYSGSDKAQYKRYSSNMAHINQRKGKSVNSKESAGHQLLFTSRSSTAEPVISLDEIRQLYKSVPNISTTEEAAIDETPRSSRRAQQHTEKAAPNVACGTEGERRGSPVQARSPTDSGYRSTPRHLHSSSANIARVPRNEHSISPLSVDFADVNDSLAEKYSHGWPAQGPTVVLISEDSRRATRDTNGFDTNSSVASERSCDQSEREFCYPTVTTCSSLCSSRSVASEDCTVQRCSKAPFEENDIISALRKGRCKDLGNVTTPEVVTRLLECLWMLLRHLSVEIQRLSNSLSKCTFLDLKTAVKVTLNSTVAESCIKAGVQASSIYALSGTGAFKLSMSQRAGLHFDLGRFYRWMIEMEISDAVSDQAAVFLCAVMECLLEEIVIAFAKRKGDATAFAKNLQNGAAEEKNVLWLLLSLVTRRCQNDTSKMRVQAKRCEASSKLNYDHPKIERELRVLVERACEEECAMNCEGGHKQRNTGCAFTRSGLNTLFYFIKSKNELAIKCCHSLPSTSFQKHNWRTSSGSVCEWVRIARTFAAHRYSELVDDEDVRQAARVLLPNTDCPPRNAHNWVSLNTHICLKSCDPNSIKKQLGFSLLRSGNSDVVDQAVALLGPLKQRTLNEYGLTALSEAILTDNENAAEVLIAAGFDVNVPVPAEAQSNQPSWLASEFAGWTALTWAVARRNASLVGRLIDAHADVESSFMIKETPLQLASMIGDSEIVVRLMRAGADPFRTSVSYDSLNCDFRYAGSPSAITLVASRGDRQLLRAMLAMGGNCKRTEEHISLQDFLDESGVDEETSSSNRDHRKFWQTSALVDSGFTISREQQRALVEAHYFAAETGHLEVAIDLHKIGVPWNAHTWAICLRTACEQTLRSAASVLLGEFNARLVDELSQDNIADVVFVLFEVLRSECTFTDGDPTPAASIISRLYKQFCANSYQSEVEGTARQPNVYRPSIDLKYVDNPELSDIRFLIEGRIVYAHRIVLVNASDVFKKLLDNPKGQIDIDNMPYSVFRLLMEYLYSGGFSELILDKPLSLQMRLIEAARRFGIGALVVDCKTAIRSQIRRDTVVDIYKYVMGNRLCSVSADCENFILEELSSLVEDRRMRLMFERKPHSDLPDLCAELSSRFRSTFEAHSTR